MESTANAVHLQSSISNLPSSLSLLPSLTSAQRAARKRIEWENHEMMTSDVSRRNSAAPEEVLLCQNILRYRGLHLRHNMSRRSRTLRMIPSLAMRVSGFRLPRTNLRPDGQRREGPTRYLRKVFDESVQLCEAHRVPGECPGSVLHLVSMRSCINSRRRARKSRFLHITCIWKICILRHSGARVPHSSGRPS